MRILSNEYRSNVPGQSKIAHGGPGNFARTFSDYVVAAGHEWIGIVHEFAEQEKTTIKKRPSAGSKSYYSCTFSHAHYMHPLHQEAKVDPRLWFAPQVDAIRKLIRRVKPDLLFLGGFSLYAWILLEAARQEGLPIVIQHSGISKTEFEQYKHLYTRAGRSLMLDLEREITRCAAKQVFLNEYSREYFRKQVADFPERQAMIIPLPYLGSFAKAPARKTVSSAHTKKTALTIGCVARWDRIKNHKAILQLAKAAKREKLPWTFKSVTSIPETAVEQAFKDAYRANIEVVAPMEQAGLTAFYQSVDVLVLPSKFDVSPTVVMEAALMGKPTLISKTVGWTSEYRDCGLSPWIVDFSDAKAVVRTLKRLAKKPVPNTFRRHILAKHAPKTVFAKYLNLFASVI